MAKSFPLTKLTSLVPVYSIHGIDRNCAILTAYSSSLNLNFGFLLESVTMVDIEWLEVLEVRDKGE